MFAPVVTRAREAGAEVRAYLSMCFGDPWEGPVEIEQVVGVGRQLLDLGAGQLSLGDTIGVATAGHVTALVEAFTEAGIRSERLALHFHDTYGQALSNVQAGLRAGVTTYDASAGGLGGCPFARSATGNLATEDLVWLLTRSGDRARRRPGRPGRDQRLDGRPAGPAQPVRRRARPGRHNRPMSRRVFVHIGAPKTGTTYLQARLGRNVRAWPGTGSTCRTGPGSPPSTCSTSGPHSTCSVPGLGWSAGPRRGRLGAFVRRARRREGTVILSHEILAPAAPAEVARAQARPARLRDPRRLHRP